MNKAVKRIGAYLSKDTTKPIICEDTTLKEQLETLREEIILNTKEKEWTQEEYFKFQEYLQDSVKNIEKDVLESLETILNSIETTNWTSIDYNNFMTYLLKLNVQTFQSAYPILLNLIHLPKEQLQRKLEYYNEKLDLHLYYDKKNLSSESNYTKYEFEPKDLVMFVSSLHSKINSFKSILSRKYQAKIDSCILEKEKNDEIELLLEELMNGNSEILNIINSSYYQWLNCIDKDDFIYSLLEQELPNIINENKVDLRRKVFKYHVKLEQRLNNYTWERREHFLRRYEKAKGRLKGSFYD